MKLNELSASEAARLIAKRSISSEELVRSCLDRIEARESVLHAWASLNPDHAIAQARACDAARSRGPLHGVPMAVKDVLDTMDFPTEMGSPIYAGHRPACDAACVALVRSAGAIILGKTVTAEFAGATPGPTTNPLNPARTPGGSSSGSGAAVADFMAPAAFGTQTGGSILRPASYCGVIGYKPSFGTVNRAGLKFAAESFDTIGLLARSLDDIRLIWSALVGSSKEPAPLSGDIPRFAVCRTHVWDQASPESVAAVEATAAGLSRAGAIVEELIMPADFVAVTKARAIINNYERARSLLGEWALYRDRISPKLATTIEIGLATSYEDYLRALRTCRRWRAWLAAAAANWDSLITPAAIGEAPEGLSSTGDPCFQEIWTALHVPTLSLPLRTGPHGMPVGVQFVGRQNDDEVFLSAAAWILGALGAGSQLSKARL